MAPRIRRYDGPLARCEAWKPNGGPRRITPYRCYGNADWWVGEQALCGDHAAVAAEGKPVHTGEPKMKGSTP